MTSAPETARRVRRPSFICVGAGKAGTTWLWEMLRLHPGIYLPDVKEIHYFNDIAYEGSDVRNPNFRKPVGWYLRFFAAARPEQVCGEISPSYLWSETAPDAIHAFDPGMRILIMLRDPVDRLFSSYLFGQQKGEIGRVSFEEALRSVDYLLARAPCSGSVARYLELFGRSQVKVVFHEELTADPRRLVLDVEEFLGVAPFVPGVVTERRNVTVASRFPAATEFLMRNRIRLKRHGLEWLVDAGKWLGLVRVFRWFQAQVEPYHERPIVSAETEAALREFFLEDVEALERLLGVDLGAWKPAGSAGPGTSGRSGPART
jgi:hypothetical protein